MSTFELSLTSYKSVKSNTTITKDPVSLNDICATDGGKEALLCIDLTSTNAGQRLKFFNEYITRTAFYLNKLINGDTDLISIRDGLNTYVDDFANDKNKTSDYNTLLTNVNDYLAIASPSKTEYKYVSKVKDFLTSNPVTTGPNPSTGMAGMGYFLYGAMHEIYDWFVDTFGDDEDADPDPDCVGDDGRCTFDEIVTQIINNAEAAV